MMAGLQRGREICLPKGCVPKIEEFVEERDTELKNITDPQKKKPTTQFF